MGSEPDYPPYCMIDKDGNADGFSVELFLAAAEAVGLEVEIKIGIWNKIKYDLAEGRINALPFVGRTPEREKIFDFTMPYLSLHGAVFVRKGTTGIDSLPDLYGKEIAVMKGDNAEEFVRREKVSDKIITTNTFEEAFQKLANGDYDAVITQRVMGIELLKEMGINSIEPLGFQIPEFRQDFCFAVQEGDDVLLERLNEGLSIIIANETYKKIRLKWFGPAAGEKLTIKDIIKVVLILLIPVLIIVSAGWIILLRSTVKNKTRSLLVEISHHKQTQQLLKQKIKELTAVHEASKSLQKLRSLKDLSKEIIKILEKNFHYKYAAILLIDKDSGHLKPFVLSDQEKGSEFVDKDLKYVQSFDLKIGNGITGWVAENGKSLKIDDVSQDDRYINVLNDSKSELCVPLKVSNETIGVINIESKFPAAYSDSDLIIMETFAATIAIAIKNMQLLRDLQKKIIQYKRIESELLNVKSNLEKKVDERTRQLKEKVDKLDKNQKAMIYMVEDLNRIAKNLKIERQKLEYANKDLESFSYSVSHDLRAPLRHINGYIKLITDRFNDSLPDKGKHYLHIIEESANHMGTLIDDLLQFSRTGRKTMKSIRLNMNALIDEVLERLKSDIKDRSIKWHIDDLPAVWGDPSLIKIVWSNLIGNAVKYTSNSSRAIIEVHYSETNKEYIFEVKDNGVGFDMKYAHKLFGVFERLHSESEFKGTGIGLATVRKIILRHGGRTWAKSQLNIGSSFFFSIPKKKTGENEEIKKNIIG
ncbi:MAG: transporter substrate-binding domain-containing protein [Fidelibacterota bacterium]